MNDGPNARQHVVILEPNGDGHRLAYVADLARRALQADCRVTLVVPINAAEVKVHLGELVGRCEMVAHRRSESLSSLSKRLVSDVLVVPDGDRVAASLGLRSPFRREWTGRGSLRVLLMRWGSEARRRSIFATARSFVKRAAVLRASRLRGVSIVALASATGADVAGEFRLAPDPVRVSSELHVVERLRTKWGVVDGRPVAALVGALDRRKNLPVVLDAIALADRKEVVLVIAGRIDPSVLDEIDPKVAALRKLGHSVFLEDRTLSDAELDSTIAAADYVILAHSNEGPSGILGKAMVLGTGIVAAGAESLRRDVAWIGRDLDSWCALSPDALAKTLAGVKAHDHSARVTARGPEDFASVVLGMARAS